MYLYCVTLRLMTGYCFTDHVCIWMITVGRNANCHYRFIYNYLNLAGIGDRWFKKDE